MNQNDTPSGTEVNVAPEITRLLGYLKQDPGNEPLTFDIIDRCIAQNQLQLAREVLQQASRRWPDAVGVLNRKAIIALRDNDPASAIIDLEKILTAAKADAAIRYNLAYANYLLGNYVRVCEVIDPVLGDVGLGAMLDPLYLLSLQQLNKTDAAIAFAESRLKIRPDDTELQGVVALLYLDAERDVGLCREYVDSALRHNPAHPMALIAASSLALMDENPGAAHDFARKVVERNPNDGRAWSSIGLIHMFNRDMVQAEKAMQLAVQNMPNHIGLWHALAWAQLFQNDIDGAETSFNRAAEIDRSWGETQAGLAVIAWLRKDKVKSKRLLDRARRIAPGGMTLMYMKYLQILDSEGMDGARQYMFDLVQKLPSFKGDTLLDTIRRMKKPK